MGQLLRGICALESAHCLPPPNLVRRTLQCMQTLLDTLDMLMYRLRAGYDWVSARLLFTRFWHRLFGTAAIWFCNDWCDSCNAHHIRIICSI